MQPFAWISLEEFQIGDWNNIPLSWEDGWADQNHAIASDFCFGQRAISPYQKAPHGIKKIKGKKSQNHLVVPNPNAGNGVFAIIKLFRSLFVTVIPSSVPAISNKIHVILSFDLGATYIRARVVFFSKKIIFYF